MSKILAGMAAFALLGVLALSPASAAERRSDGLTSKSAAASTDLSAQRYWGGRYWGARRAYWGPRPWLRPYYRPYYAGYGYPYYGGYPYYAGYPYYYSRPVASIGFGFGPGWGPGWGWGWGW
jgi:hypothetical protein